jgi:hypothetical protein
LVTYSEQMDHAAWQKLLGGTGLAPVVTPNATIAPDGALTADRIVFDKGVGTTSTDQSILQSTVPTSVTGQPASAFMWLKSATASNYVMRLDFSGQSGEGAGFLSLITVTPTWQRFEIRIASAIDTTRRIHLRLRGTQNTDNFADIYAWGAQQENGAFATSYIPTVVSQVTRAADSASMTGVNFSSWYNQAQGSIYAEVTTPAPASVSSPGFMWYASSGSADNRIELRQLGSGDASPRINSIFRTNGVTVVNTLVQTTTIGWTSNNIASAKISLGYQVNDVYLTSDKANTPANDLDAAMPSVNNVLFNHTGHYKKLAYYPQRLSNTELQGLTA